MKLPFTLRDRPVQGNFDMLAGHLGFERVRIGTVQLVFTASALTPSIPVAHGLGLAPRLVAAITQSPTVTWIAAA
jgi:hypothetical protein